MVFRLTKRHTRTSSPSSKHTACLVFVKCDWLIGQEAFSASAPSAEILAGVCGCDQGSRLLLLGVALIKARVWKGPYPKAPKPQPLKA